MDIHDIAMAANIAAKGGGTSDYTDLDNKPSINGEELSGNMTAAQLGLVGLDSGGKVPINQLPPAAVERMTVVENDTARFALTTDRVQNGDTVKVTATNKMYMVVDDTNLGTEAGYSVYVAGRAAEAVADEDGNNIKESLASKVDKVTGKSLSTNDYTTADKEKLNGIETQANKTVVDDALSSSSENPVQNKIIKSVLDTKVDKETGKGLSTEDFTAAEKTKLAGLRNYDDTQVRADIEALEGSRYTKAETDALLDEKQDTLTSAQLAAGNSGVTAEKVAQYDDIYAVINYNALNHNGIYRGKDLTNIYTVDEMYARIHNGTFEDLYLGDYFTKSITTDVYTKFTGAEFAAGTTYYERSGENLLNWTYTETEDAAYDSTKTYYTKLTKTENVTLMFAAFDYYYQMGDTACTTHHAILIPRNNGFATAAKMNLTNTTIGAYYNSEMHQTTLPCYAKSLKTALNNHLLSHRTILSNTVNTSTPSMAGAGFTGASTNWAWVTTELQLMTEQQVYGTRAWTSSAFDIGIDYRILPVFNFINPVLFSRDGFWLRSVVSSTNFAFCYALGSADNFGASLAVSVFPLILFG